MNINTSDIHIIIPMRKTKVFYELIRNDTLTCYVKKVELRFNSTQERYTRPEEEVLTWLNVLSKCPMLETPINLKSALFMLTSFGLCFTSATYGQFREK